MKQQLENRLKELKAEFEAGQRMMADLDAKRANLQESVLRISGAIQVLEEELAKVAQAEESDEEQSESKTEKAV
jgi:predicted nuclease with TOPRIM domain